MEKQEQRLLSFGKTSKKSNPTVQLTWAQKDSNLHISVKGLLAGHQHKVSQELITSSYVIIELQIDRLFSALKTSISNKHPWEKISQMFQDGLFHWSMWNCSSCCLKQWWWEAGAGCHLSILGLLTLPFQKNNRHFCWIRARTKLILTQLAYWLFPHVVWQDKITESKN